MERVLEWCVESFAETKDDLIRKRPKVRHSNLRKRLYLMDYKDWSSKLEEEVIGSW